MPSEPAKTWAETHGAGRDSTVWGISGLKGQLLALLGTIGLMLVTPAFVMFVYVVHSEFNGSVTSFAAWVGKEGISRALGLYARPSLEAWIVFGTFGLIEAIFQLGLPGKMVKGPVTPEGNIPIYRANGIQAFLATLLMFAVAACVLNVFAFGLCVALYFKGHIAPSTTDSGTTRNVVYDFYWGMELYPRIGKAFDIKTWTNCRVGMMSWAVLILCYAAKQYELYGFVADSMVVSVLLMEIYIFKFFFWETGYWSSMDIAHDRAGYYLCWGCLNWVPGIYTSPALYLVKNPVVLGFPVASLITVCGIMCIAINYDADRQRQSGRRDQDLGKSAEDYQGNIQNRQGLDQDVPPSRIWLVHPFPPAPRGIGGRRWGLARHFHYVPEILGAFFWTVPGLFNNGLQFFYVLFLTLLLVDRSYRDDERCRSKYGKYWDEYCSYVPFKLIPGVF